LLGGQFHGKVQRKHPSNSFFLQVAISANFQKGGVLMNKKETCWRWLNVLYFCGGMVASLVGVVILRLKYPNFPRELFAFILVIYFVVVGVPFMLLTTKWLLPKTNRADN